jgi:hypothetical protein
MSLASIGMRDEKPAYPRQPGRWGRVGAALLLFTTCSPGRAQSGKETPEILIVGRSDVLDAGQVSSSDTASLLSGVDSAQAGGVSGLPMIHGLGDDRIRTLVDGVPVAAACPMHMNPPLSYIDRVQCEILR